MFRLVYISSTLERVVKYIDKASVNDAIDKAFEDGAQFVTIKPIPDAKVSP